VFFLFTWVEKSLAQQVFFCRNYHSEITYNELLSSHSSTFKIDPIKGDSIFLIFASPQYIPKPKIYVFIDKKNTQGKYEEFDNQRISILESEQKIAICKYLFNKEGNYKIIFANAEKKEIISTLLSISFETNLIFCEQVDRSDYPIGYESFYKAKNKNLFRLNENAQTDLYAYLKLSKPIGSKEVFLEIYQHDGKGYNYLVSNSRFSINPAWEYTYFKTRLDKAGKYRVRIKDDKEKVLGVNYLEIID
jgi:hypothetical protein